MLKMYMLIVLIIIAFVEGTCNVASKPYESNKKTEETQETEETNESLRLEKELKDHLPEIVNEIKKKESLVDNEIEQKNNIELNSEPIESNLKNKIDTPIRTLKASGHTVIEKEKLVNLPPPIYNHTTRKSIKEKDLITKYVIKKKLKTLNIEEDLKQNSSLTGYSILNNFSEELKKQFILGQCNKNEKIDRSVGAIAGMSIGDYVGAPLEFNSIENLNSKSERQQYKFNLSTLKYTTETNKFKIELGQWTDDASMGLCMADSLIINKKYDGSDIRIRFWNWWYRGYNNAFRNDKERNSKTSIGLGGNIRNSLEALKANCIPNKEFKNPKKNYKDDSGNGSLMRLAPIPIFYSKESSDKAIEMSKKSSYTTHPGHTAAESCGLLGYIISRAINRRKNDISMRDFLTQVLKDYLKLLKLDKESDKNKKESLCKLIKLIKSEGRPGSKEYNWNWKTTISEYKNRIKDTYYLRSGRHGAKNKKTLYNGYPVSDIYWGAYCLDGLAIALNAVYNSTSFETTIENAVNFLGDADSVGSMAGQIAGAFYGFKCIYNSEKGKKLVYLQSKWDDWDIPLKGVLLFYLNQDD